MSQENVEIVRRVYEATARRDAAAVAELYDPDVEWDDSGSPPAELGRMGMNRGYEALQAWFREWHEAWENLTYECEELIDAGDQVVSIVTMRGRGRASGLEVEWPQYALWTIRGSKIVRTQWFRTREAALAAADATPQAPADTQHIELNGVAHIQISVNRFEECVAFYDRVMAFLGLRAVHRSDAFVYYVGGRTAYNVSRADPRYAGDRHDPGRPGLHHICFRARSREDIDALYVFLQEIGATMVRAPEEGPWAPGYYSLSFLDPDGIRLEVNHVPGKGVFAEGATFDPAPDYPLTGRPRS